MNRSMRTMNIKIIAIGKLKENYLKTAVEEYSKRLGRFVRLNVIELAESRLPDKASAKDEEKTKAEEAGAILSKIEDSEFVIAMSPDGKHISSTEFADLIKEKTLYGTSSITFVIGGSLGLGPELLKRANLQLSFSKMTFPHQLFRVILLEQIYRAFKINNNETYHK